ncbi:aromatic ring-hydroxylating dioxygenase subunit alpha [Eubacteriaceae bacterium ES2]|nr:aromatic ring-hydroxylating dioxygenase subunit alpha [Eubacteriaceae bacterium ES2]
MIPNQWYAILPSRAVKSNQLLAVKRLNLELVLFRSSGGKLGCIIDQCSHRGAALSKGKVKGDCIQCPFHGLEFDPDGRCTFVPANGKAFADDLSRFNVKEYVVREKNGIIYLWYGDPTRITDHLPFFDGDVDESYSFSEIEDHWNSHYSRSIENQLDVVHLPFVHHNTIGRGDKTLVNGPKVEFVPGAW